ncbi:tetraacyldisaccharide 4'-kinase [Winogradskyella sp. UBA3174]|uniref:tetraacyldisaccharide 4'-kinase n=1 Tax=Winogradskyella sp. UBA3174 TaxID=1947785 RepID=UPI0025D794BC|nr:tetraacyldisaccharide 4'-kinase [Winogradskyella sp. UBA3174]|tara:strand:+ start:45183 stop:46181 length:999 start_codon:yes stop_codon:yes gene_type:complete
MKFIRIILFPIVPIYFIVTWFRNCLYDRGIKHSQSYDFPLICVGNLSTGGTGKTPMIEYLIRLLKDKKSLATLSRGYKRQSEGFVLADKNTSASIIGDEPFQFYNKFNCIKVAVDADRLNGISKLMGLKEKSEVILLDDAFQHRQIRAGFNILLTAYNNLYFKDIVLPTGNLREPRFGANRADIIVITKCDKNISEIEKVKIVERLKLKSHQHAFFSYIDYNDSVLSFGKSIKLEHLPRFTLVTGIANAKPLVDFLSAKGLQFDHLEYADHYDFKVSDVDKLRSIDLIVTTEKDFMRLSGFKNLEENLYYLPIRLKLHNAEAFDKAVETFVN